MRQFKSGWTVGNGAAINIQLGWIPDLVQLWNVTDGDIVTYGFLNEQAIPFSGGGVNEITAGMLITGVTSRATARVQQVLLYSGSWAGGDAAGFFIVDRDTITGTFSGENIIGTAAGATDDATVTANVTHSMSIVLATASAAGNAALTAYAGSAGSASKGFTIGSTVAEEAKLLRWQAWRDG